MASCPYQAINLPYETRILILEPGSFASSLVCTIFPMSLASPPPYSALSYCWSKSITPPPNIDFSKPIASVICDPSSHQAEHHSVALRDALNHPHLAPFYVRFGGALPPETITCNGVAGIPIGGELARALRRIRPDPGHVGDEETVEPLRIWVDALCIDQSNKAERSAHVQLMAQIYAGADMVHVWIGEEIGVEAGAMQAIRDALAVFEEILWDPAKAGWGGKTFEARQAEVSFHPRFRSAEWDRLGEFLGRSWFERIWVVQEIANAKQATVYCGRYSLPWRALSTVIQTMRECKVDDVLCNPRAVTAISVMAQYRREQRPVSVGHPAQAPASLLDVLEEVREFDSTLASDKIYAALGLAKMQDRKRVVVDYSKTPERLFTEFAISELRKGSADVLTHCVWSGRPFPPKGLPSWVPDWTRPGATPPFRFRGLQCQAAGNTKMQIVEIDEQTGTIELVGRVLDKVAAVDDKAHIPWGGKDALGPVNPIRIDSPDQLVSEIQRPGFCSPEDRNRRQDDRDRRLMSESTANVLRNIAFPDDGRAVSLAQFDAVWQAWICNRTRDNRVPGAEFGMCWAMFMGLLTGFSFWKKLPTAEAAAEPATGGASSVAETVLIHVMDPRRPGSKAPPAGWQPIHSESQTWAQETYLALLGAHSKWCYRRRFYRTVNGRFGWTVDGTQPGDLIVLFHGCHYPFVLRPVVGGAEAVVFRIVGDCYIQGLMDGEGLDDAFPVTALRII